MFLTSTVYLYDEMDIEVKINCSYKLGDNHHETRFALNRIPLEEAVKEANAFIQEKLALVDDEYRLPHIQDMLMVSYGMNIKSYSKR